LLGRTERPSPLSHKGPRNGTFAFDDFTGDHSAIVRTRSDLHTGGPSVLKPDKLHDFVELNELGVRDVGGGNELGEQSVRPGSGLDQIHNLELPRRESTHLLAPSSIDEHLR
jgi:hypothetical protein